MQPLTRAYFARPTLDVARDLIGKLLVHEHPEGRLVGRIVETEGYTQDDEAFHGWGIVDRETGLIKPEGRGYDLFGKPGNAYIYLIYTRYWLLNVVTEPEGVGGAVLIRAVEPLEGTDRMYDRRPAAQRDVDLTNGPGKLTDAFDVDKGYHNHPLVEAPLYFADDGEAPDWTIATSARIGLTRGIDAPWRFFADGHPFVSPGVPSDIAAAKRRTKRNR